MKSLIANRCVELVSRLGELNLVRCDVLDQIEGIEYAIQHADQIDVINLSLENPNSPSLNKQSKLA
jgi:hypothetical protein